MNGAESAGCFDELDKLVSIPLSPLGGIGTRHGGGKGEWLTPGIQVEDGGGRVQDR